jgi:hypothetical protein
MKHKVKIQKLKKKCSGISVQINILQSLFMEEVHDTMDKVCDKIFEK